MRFQINNILFLNLEMFRIAYRIRITIIKKVALCGIVQNLKKLAIRSKAFQFLIQSSQIKKLKAFFRAIFNHCLI